MENFGLNQQIPEDKNTLNKQVTNIFKNDLLEKRFGPIKSVKKYIEIIIRKIKLIIFK